MSTIVRVRRGGIRHAMSELTRQRRLDLAVRAEVARARADQAKERTAFLERGCRPLSLALEHFPELYGRKPYPEHDLSALLALAPEFGSGDLDARSIAAIERGYREFIQLDDEAAHALRAVSEAMHADGAGHGTTVRNWVACTGEEFDRSVAEALGLPTADERD
jgi:hypothetical protein